MRLTPVRTGSERSDLLRGVPPLSRLMFICLKRFFVDLLFVIRVCTFLDVHWLVDSLWFVLSVVVGVYWLIMGFVVILYDTIGNYYGK
jgi:hypothetical protein